MDFAAVCLRWRPQVLKFCVVLWRDLDAAEDATQEVLLRAFVHRARFNDGGERALKAWLFAIARNYYTDCGRRASYQARQSHGVLPSVARSAESDAMPRLMAGEILAALDAMRPDWADVLRCAGAEFREREACAVLDVTLPAYGAMLCRARAELRKRVA